MNTITFEPVSEAVLAEFKKRVQTAFSLALIEPNGKALDKPVPADRDIERNYYGKEAETYNIYVSGQRVGGVILTINRKSNHNHLELFFIDPEYHSTGYGYAAWKAIEAKYPDTEVWHTGTPYFEKRNIHFYVNKCGFQINEFYCERHPDPHCPQEEYSEDNDGMEEGFFDFEKVMKPKKPEPDPVFIETDRLILRNFREGDAGDLFEYLRNPRVHCFMDEKLDNMEEAVETVKKFSSTADESVIAVCLKDGGKLIGHLFAGKEMPDTYSVYWHFSAAFEGKGYAYESAKAYLAYLFTQKNSRRIYAYVEDDNFRSQHLCERLGMRKEGCFKEFISFVNNPDGTPLYENTMQYAILKKEFH